MSCGVGHRGGSDLALLWLWRRPVATAPIRPLAWEPPYAVRAAQEKTKKKKRKKEKKSSIEPHYLQESHIQASIHLTAIIYSCSENTY